ncbi:MAG: ABC transporter substrate-binding protein [Schleiferilactobacillus perolens]|uniref:ABC transporter substrate-binding protein n=1 Tax=Schleiferilactobacillus perolens TaxID=100468 RepID=UPI0039EB5A28
MKKNFWKHLMIIGAAVLGTVALTACGSGNKNNASGGSSASVAIKDEDKGPITIWTTSNTMKLNAEKWAKGASKKVKVVIVPYADFDTKLKQQVNDPSTAPDVFIVSRDFVKDWESRSSVILDLSKSFKKDAATYKKNAFSDIYARSLNEKGDLVTVTAEYPVGMMFYNRTIAKDILGSDDPDKVTEAMSSVSKWQDVNKKLQEKYGSKTKLFGTSADTLNMLSQQRTAPYVKDKTFTVDKSISTLFDRANMLYKDKMFTSIDDAEAFQAGFNNNAFFVEFLPTWGFSFKVAPQLKDKAGAGKWGVAQPTMSYARGGSFYFITQSSKHKKSAWDYIKAQTIDTKNLYETQKSIVGYPSSKVAAKQLVDSDYEEPLLDNQKVFSMYSKQAAVQEKESKDTVTKYDGAILGFIGDLIKDYGAGNVTKDAALQKLGQQVKSAYPDLTVKYNYK